MGDVKNLFFSSVFFKRSDFVDDIYQKCENIERWNSIADRFDRWEQNRILAERSIPKIIHQIWLGSPLPEEYKEWISSWKSKNPEWKYYLWDDVAIKKFGLVNERIYKSSPSYGVKSDIARYEILYRIGGVYADTDFECLSSFDDIANRCSLFIGANFSSSPSINNGLIGSVPGHPLIGKLIQHFEKPIKTKDGMAVLAASGPIFLTDFIFNNFELLLESDIIFPSTYFYPFPNYEMDHVPLNEARRRFAHPWSLAIHYWEASWLKPSLVRKTLSRIKKYLLKIMRFIKRDAGFVLRTMYKIIHPRPR